MTQPLVFPFTPHSHIHLMIPSSLMALPIISASNSQVLSFSLPSELQLHVCQPATLPLMISEHLKIKNKTKPNIFSLPQKLFQPPTVSLLKENLQSSLYSCLHLTGHLTFLKNYLSSSFRTHPNPGCFSPHPGSHLLPGLLQQPSKKSS